VDRWKKDEEGGKEKMGEEKRGWGGEGV